MNRDDFTLVGLILWPGHQAGADGVVADVLPFLVISFVTAQKVVKESPLPGFAGNALASQGFAQGLFDQASPLFRVELNRAGRPGKRMGLILLQRKKRPVSTVGHGPMSWFC
jgi:hypothetical protein